MESSSCSEHTKPRVPRLAILLHTSLEDMSIFSSYVEDQARTETHWRKSGSRSPSEALAIPEKLWIRSKHETRHNAGLLRSPNIIVRSTCAMQARMGMGMGLRWWAIIVPWFSLKLRFREAAEKPTSGCITEIIRLGTTQHQGSD